MLFKVITLLLIASTYAATYYRNSRLDGTSELVLGPDETCVTRDGLNGAFKQNCNWCYCSGAGGSARCTLIGCPPEDPGRRENPECRGEVKWRMGTSVCECIDDIGSCQEINQDESPTTLLAQAEKVFQEGRYTCYAPDGPARYKMECNWCSCGEGSGNAWCTLKFCISGRYDEVPQCEGVVVWKQGAEICECVDGEGVCITPRQ